MKAHPELISTAGEIQELARTLRAETIIAFDTEFIRESTFYPLVEIIQVATRHESWLVDAQVFKKNHKPGPQGGFDPGIVPLLEVFSEPSILKVLHAAQGDQECLYTSFGAVSSPVLDTAVAASLCGMGEAIGLGRLLKDALNVTIKKGHARTNWSVRPLPPQLLEYAHVDVEHLVVLAEMLMEQLGGLGRREWALELSGKWGVPALYEPDYEGIAQKLSRGGRMDRKAYGVLLELVRWRENRVRQLNLPRRWVADDTVLTDLANVKPTTLDHLASFRGLNKGEIKSGGEQILHAIQVGLKAEVPPPPRGARPNIPTTEESQVLDLLRCYVQILADRHRIAARHLMTSAQLLPLLRQKIECPQDLVENQVLSGEAARLIGEELIAFLRGKRALSVHGTRIRVVKTEI